MWSLGLLWSGCSRILTNCNWCWDQCCSTCVEECNMCINYDILFALDFTEKFKSFWIIWAVALWGELVQWLAGCGLHDWLLLSSRSWEFSNCYRHVHTGCVSHTTFCSHVAHYCLAQVKVVGMWSCIVARLWMHRLTSTSTYIFMAWYFTFIVQE